MASNQIITNLFDYGDTVQVKPNAPVQYNPKAIGSICGIRQIKSEAVASYFQQAVNSNLYLIEFNDGNSIEIPEVYLLKI